MSYSLNTQVMLILVLINVQYSRRAIFSIEKGSIGQNYSSSGSYCLVKKSPPPSNISDFPHFLPLFGKPCLPPFSLRPPLFGFFWNSWRGFRTFSEEGWRYFNKVTWCHIRFYLGLNLENLTATEISYSLKSQGAPDEKWWTIRS